MDPFVLLRHSVLFISIYINHLKAIFTISIDACDVVVPNELRGTDASGSGGKYIQSKLHLVDLAGAMNDIYCTLHRYIRTIKVHIYALHS